MKKYFFASAILGSAVVSTSTACDLCSVYSAAQARGDIGKGFYAGGAQQFTHFGTLQEDGTKVPNTADQYMNSSISQLYGGYNFSERFGVQLNLPFISRWYRRSDEAGGTERGNVHGLGDTALLAHFQPIHFEKKAWTFSWTILGGVKFPTGRTGRLHEEVDEVLNPNPNPIPPESGVHGHDLTLGSGSYDGIVGSGLFARYNRFFFNGSVQYSIRTKGDFDYRFANDLTWSGGPGAYLLLKDDYTLALQLSFSGESKGKDRFMGADADDTAITSYYLGPQFVATWQEHLSAELGVDIPIKHDNTALQSVPDYRIRAGVTWHFLSILTKETLRLVRPIQIIRADHL